MKTHIFEEEPNPTSFRYNLTVTNNSIQLFYTNLPRVTKKIEEEDINFDKLAHDNLKYQTKDEIEKALDTDGFIVLKNALHFTKVQNTEVWISPSIAASHDFVSLYKSIELLCFRGYHTILMDDNIEKRFPERFI